ncbi:uncharacterized protein, partial [Anabrus simplex]|uniref:uncharacterized protein n=1 Tax=Anabrus simplex TaxID=316456 RepID=UPI0035A2E1AD
MIRRRFRNQVMDCKAFPGEDVDSDHNLLVMKCRLKLKKLKKGKNATRWNLDKLKEKSVRDCFKKHVAQGLNEKAEGNTIEEEWIVMRNEVSRAAEEMLGRKKRSTKNQWITQEILDLMDERRKCKNARNEEDRKEYRRLKNQLDRKCKVAKEEWLKEKCKDVEGCMVLGKVNAAYRKIKETFGERKSRCMNMKSSDGKPLLEKEEKAERWQEHIQ